MRAMPYNPVLIFKQEEEPQSNAMDNLGNDDFLLALQTEFQKMQGSSMVISVF